MSVLQLSYTSERMLLEDPCKYQIGCVSDFIFRVVKLQLFLFSVSVVTSGTNCSVGISVCCERLDNTRTRFASSETLALQTFPSRGVITGVDSKHPQTRDVRRAREHVI